MSMLERSSGGIAMVLENQNVLEPAVFLQVKDAVAEGPQYVFDSLGRQLRKCRIVIIGFDNHFVRADAVHLVEHALGLAVQIAFNSQSGEFVRDHPHSPAGRIALRRTAILVGPVGLNLRRGLAFVPVAEGAETALHFYCVAGKVSGALGSVGRNDDPATDDRVFSKFRQFTSIPPARSFGQPSFYAESAAF